MAKNKILFNLFKYHLVCIISYYSVAVLSIFLISIIFPVINFFNKNLDLDVAEIVVLSVVLALSLIFGCFIVLKEVLTYKKLGEVFAKDNEKKFIVSRFRNYSILICISSFIPFILVLISFIVALVRTSGQGFTITNFLFYVGLFFVWIYFGSVSDRKSNMVSDEGLFYSGEYVVKFSDIKNITLVKNSRSVNSLKTKIRIYYTENKYFSFVVKNDFVELLKEKCHNIKTFDVDSNKFVN